jgi:hypothetical protein
MRLPWIARSTHDEIRDLLSKQIEELICERRVLLDRLATLGLGGPLFHVPEPEVDPATEEPADEEVEELERLLEVRRRPSKLADALTRKAQRDLTRVNTGPRVKWVSQAEAVSAALNEAEALGKQNSFLPNRI